VKKADTLSYFKRHEDRIFTNPILPAFLQIYLTEWAWILAEQGKLPELIDERLRANVDEHAKAIDTMTRVCFTRNLA
jgi:hypothetical protein